jgi:hypothetical protein
MITLKKKIAYCPTLMDSCIYNSSPTELQVDMDLIVFPVKS